MRLLTFSFLKTCKYKKLYIGLPRRISSVIETEPRIALRDPTLVEISPSWEEADEPALRSAVLRDMLVYPHFISPREEEALLLELEPVLRRMRYEFDHWDNAIQGFRETERTQWSAENSAVLARVRALAASVADVGGVGGVAGVGGADFLPHVHVLDLAAAGHIRPHVDAVRFCGDVIAGLCLASSAVMQLVHVTHKHMEVNALLARRGLYIMNNKASVSSAVSSDSILKVLRSLKKKEELVASYHTEFPPCLGKGVARYDFTHAVLGGADSAWRGDRLARQRRVALICRTKPHPHDAPPDFKLDSDAAL